jgi:predicted RecA/RadA family phage recombinase
MINTDLVKGDNLVFLDSQITHPTHAAPNRTLSGDAVVIGRLAGVAASSALVATTDSIAVVFRGVFKVPVVSIHNGLSVGETVFIDPSTAVLSDDLTAVPFGTALDTVPSNGVVTTIRVKLFGHTPGAVGAGS